MADHNGNDLASRLKAIQQREAEKKHQGEQKEGGEQVSTLAVPPDAEPPKPKRQLPLWPELERAIPNHIARSSLFAPIARGRRKIHDKVLLTSRCDVQIFYWGKQLDEADCDVWMQALHEARRVPLGEPVPINRAAFLRAIGRNVGRSDYNWLHESFQRLAFAMLAIETKRYAIGTTPRSRVMHLVEGFDYDPDTEVYHLSIDRRMLALFSHQEFALIDWDKRRQIQGRVDLAKRLQRLVATSDETTQRYSLGYLKALCCYTGRLRDFRPAVLDALRELQRLSLIARPQIVNSSRGNEQVVLERIALYRGPDASG